MTKRSKKDNKEKRTRRLSSGSSEEINIGDIRNFLDIRRFGQLPSHLYVKALVLKTEKEFSLDSKYDCMMVEYLNNSLNYNLVEQMVLDDVQGHTLDIIDGVKPDLIMMDNSLTHIIESNKRMLNRDYAHFKKNSDHPFLNCDRLEMTISKNNSHFFTFSPGKVFQGSGPLSKLESS